MDLDITHFLGKFLIYLLADDPTAITSWFKAEKGEMHIFAGTNMHRYRVTELP